MSWLLNPFRSGTRGGRSASPSAASSGGGAAPAAAAAAPAAAVGAAVAARPQPSRATNAWASLPPLHVLHGPPTLVDWRFESQLTSWQHPMFGLKPLGHLRSPNAPGGMVVIEALQPPPADDAPAAAARPAPAAEAVELPLPVPPPAAEQPAVRQPASPSDVDEWGFPLADADPTFVQSLAEGPRDALAYYPRFEPEPAPAAEPPTEGALRAVGAPEQAFFDSLRPRLEPIAPPAEEPRDAAPPPAPVAAPELPLAAPPLPPPAPELPAEPTRMRVRFGEPAAPDAEPPAPAVPDVIAPPPVTEDRASTPPAVPEAEPAAPEVELPAARVEAAIPEAAEPAPAPADLPLVDAAEPVAPVLAESEPLVAGVEAAAEDAPQAAFTSPGEVPLDLAVRPGTLPEAEHPPVTAYFPPAEDFTTTESETEHELVTAYVLPPPEQAAPVGTEPLEHRAADAAPPAEPATAAERVPVEPPPAHEDAAVSPEVLPLLSERAAPPTVAGAAAPLAPPAPVAPANGELPLAPPSGPGLAAPAPVTPPLVRGESFEPGVPAAPPSAPLPAAPDLPTAPAAPGIPPAAAAPPAARPAPDLTLAQPPRRDSGQARDRSADAQAGAPAPPESAVPPPATTSGLRATVAPPPERPSAPDLPLAAGRPAAPPRPSAEEGPAPSASAEAPLVGEHPTTLTAPVTAPPTEGPGGGAPPEPSMPLARSASTAAPAATLVREQVTVAPLLGEREIPLQSAAAAEALGPLDGRVAPLPEPAISVRVSRASDAAARQLQARAFTHEGEVHLSSTSLAQGPREVEALVAHEMTHVLQQRILGPGRLPVESTSDGAALEAEARAVEQTVRSTGEFRLPQTSPVAMDLARYGSLMPGLQVPAAPAALSLPQVIPPDDVTPAPLSLPALTLPSLVPPAPPAPVAPPAPPVAPPAPAAPPAVEVQDGPTYHWEAPWVQVQRAPDDAAGGGGDGGASPTASAGPDHKGFIDSMHPVDKADLAEELYPFIETRLRDTLRRHRDRSGRVTDMDL